MTQGCLTISRCSNVHLGVVVTIWHHMKNIIVSFSTSFSMSITFTAYQCVCLRRCVNVILDLILSLQIIKDVSVFSLRA